MGDLLLLDRWIIYLIGDLEGTRNNVCLDDEVGLNLYDLWESERGVLGGNSSCKRLDELKDVVSLKRLATDILSTMI